ncbi:MAG TPA: Fur family transcriptional regulator [Candidatus Hydrogenedentes bacterium]|nr:Fur family transcriptional regulator [Candidatus Hydrogenedentota bacterium]HPG68018.1 Fur family transcriptional regulator [Candidatus Hydrogenedentota bacterium]
MPTLVTGTSPFSGRTRTTRAVADPSIEEAWQEFEQFLRANGHRITRARETVLRHIMGRHDHFRVDEVAAALSTGPGRVSRGTVYQTLSLLEQSGMVRRVRDDDTHAHYEHIYGHERHDHMICERCGCFIEFSHAKIDELIVKQCQRKNFARRTHHLVVFGICEACQVEAVV